MTARRTYPLVELDRRVEPHGDPLKGYLVAANEAVVVIHVLDEGYRLDGYNAFRRDTVDALDELAADAPRRAVIEAALRLRRQRPRPPRGLDVTSMRTALLTASATHDLVAIHQEQLDAEICEIGRVRLSTARSYVIDPIDPGARWERPPRRYRFADVTRVDFGNAYERVLAQVATAWGHPRPSDRPRPR